MKIKEDIIMREIKTVKVYNLLDTKGNELRLNLGMLQTRRNEVCLDNADSGWRWSFEGKKIPMPVRSGYWFNGFPEATMLEWLKGNGWAVHTCVDMITGKAKVYELPSADEKYELSGLAVEQGEKALKEAVIQLCNAGFKLKAIALYRYVHPCCLKDANTVVTKIQHET